jgi:hypothetical protein
MTFNWPRLRGRRRLRAKPRHGPKDVGDLQARPRNAAAVVTPHARAARAFNRVHLEPARGRRDVQGASLLRIVVGLHLIPRSALVWHRNAVDLDDIALRIRLQDTASADARKA